MADKFEFVGFFAGKQIDPDTGLTYHWNRWRSEDGSSFISEDPVRDGWNWYGYAGGNPMRFVDPDGFDASDVYFIVYRDTQSKYSSSDKSYRGLDRIYFYNTKTKESFNLYNVQTFVSHSNYPVGNTLEAFSGGFSIQYLGNNIEMSQLLYNKCRSRYIGPVFNVQNAHTKGLEQTNEYGEIIGDKDTTPIRIHSNFSLKKNEEVPLASGGCLMYDWRQLDDFLLFLENSEIKPGDQIYGYIKEYFEP